ncbi:MAG: PadR family transcriptional regulator [Halobacteria archaeon]
MADRNHPILRLVILKMLQERPRTGYDLLKDLASRTDGRWVPSKGALYPELERLREEGYTKVRATGPRAKKVYAITPKAAEMLKPFPLAGGFLQRNEKLMMLLFSLFRSEEERRVLETTFQISGLSMASLKHSKREVFGALDRCLGDLRSIAGRGKP